MGDWTAILRGNIYCSPACGGRCKKSEFDAATAAAAKLAKRLGPNWTPIVTENLGWHYHVESGILRMDKRFDEAYVCSCNAESPIGQIFCRDKDPLEAFAGLIKKINSRIVALQELRDSIHDATSKGK